MKIIDKPKFPKEMKEEILKFTSESLNVPKEIDIEGIFIGGSHTKGTSNKDSDIDLLLYYKHTLNSILRVDLPSITINADKVEMKEGSGMCFYDYNDKEYEISFIPIFTTTGTKKELIRNLYRQKIDYLFKFVKSEPVFMTDIGAPYTQSLKFLRNSIIEDYHWDRNAVFGYFHGYMVSQLQRHKRRVDGERRRLESFSKNSALPIVKLTIDGVYICLSGISILERQEISMDFWKLFKRYSNLFDYDEGEFIRTCYDRKLNRIAIEMKLDRWVDMAMDNRDRIFEKLNIKIHESREISELPELNHSLRKENVKILNRYLHSLYKN